MQRPLPPFRAKPARRAPPPKRLAGEVRQGEPEISVKARRLPVKLARLAPARPLKVLRDGALA